MATKQDLARSAWPVLVAFARTRRTITYGELSKGFIGGAPVGMGKPLGIVRNEALSRGLAMINSIAVGGAARVWGCFIFFDSRTKLTGAS